MPAPTISCRSKAGRRRFSAAPRVQTQPISFVTGREAPALLVTAQRDTLVSPGNTERFAARIRATGGRVEERVYNRVNHFTLIGAFAPGLSLLAPVKRDVDDFVWRVTGWAAVPAS